MAGVGIATIAAVYFTGPAVVAACAAATGPAASLVIAAEGGALIFGAEVAASSILAGVVANKAARVAYQEARDFCTDAYKDSAYVYSKNWKVGSCIAIRGGPTIH